MEFDYKSYKIIGVAEPYNVKEHACIKPIGYLDVYCTFTPLSKKEIEEMFPSQGLIFANKFQTFKPELVGKCVQLGIKPSMNDGRDEYMWDHKNGSTEEFATAIEKMTEDIFNDTPDSIYNFCDKVGWLDMHEVVYRFYGDNIYCIDPEDVNKRYIKYWNISKLNQIQELYMTADEKYYVFLGGNIDVPASYIDIMPDSELNEWLLNHFLISEWSEVLNNNDITKLKDSLRKILFECKWPKAILLPRINRALHTLESILLSVSEIKRLQKYPGLHEIIDKSIKESGEIILKETSPKFVKELENYKNICEHQKQTAKEQIDSEILKYKNTFDKVKNEFSQNLSKLRQEETLHKEQIKSQDIIISDKEKKINELDDKIEKLTKNKEKILDDFGLVKEVLELMGGSKHMVSMSNSINIETINDGLIPFKTEENFIKCLETFLSQNNRKTDIARKIFGYIIHYKTIVVPDIRIVLSILQATGKCNYIVQNITPEWRTFDKIWTNGLSDIIEKCNEDHDVINYMILQNVNLTYLPCIFQPIIDISLGLITSFPNTQIAYPKNLRIILTVTEEEGLPLAIQNIKYFGCLKKEDYTLDEEIESEKCGKEVHNNEYLSINLIDTLDFTPAPMSDFKSYLLNDDE